MSGTMSPSGERRGARPRPGPVGPVRKSITVSGGPAEAFRRFTEEIGSWWPVESHSVAGDEVGGRVFERTRAGAEATWGTVTAWDPPRRFVMTWHPGREADTAQTLEVRFSEADGDTRVELVHSGWERLGERAVEAVEGYDTGWDAVLERYVTASARG